MTGDYAMGESDARAATTRRVATLGTLSAVCLAGLSVTAWSGGSHGASVAAGVVAGVVSVVVLTAVLIRRATDRLVRLAEHVAQLRPHAVVIPALSGVEMRMIARSLGSPTSGWSTAGGSPAVLSVSSDRCEVWSGRAEYQPRWAVDRAGARVTRRAVVVSGAPWPGVQVADGLYRIVVAPRYGPVTTFSSRREEYVRRALESLGVDPQASEPKHLDGGQAPDARWHPQMTRQLRPGPSARWWEHAFTALFGTAGVFLAAACLALVLPGEPPWALPAIYAFLSCALLLGRGTLSPMLWIVDRRIEAEYAAGYATSTAAWYDDGAPVEVVDPRSRRVIRLAGELPYADRTQQKALLKDRVDRARGVARRAAV